MVRRSFSREYKLEAVKLIQDRGVTVAQAARDLDIHENVLRKWVREFRADPQQEFPGHGEMKPEQLEAGHKSQCNAANAVLYSNAFLYGNRL
jgi:transposase